LPVCDKQEISNLGAYVGGIVFHGALWLQMGVIAKDSSIVKTICVKKKL
jgi:hypothetical protein